MDELDNLFYERLVKDTITAGGHVNTCFVTDREWIFETGVCVKGFNDGDWIIVGGYRTISEAIDGHNSWVDRLLSDDKPTTIYDIYDHVFYAKDLP